MDNVQTALEPVLQAGPHRLDMGERTLVMGILNVTPDSFSDGGRYNEVNHAVDHAAQMIDAGADVIDIGGESTRPGAVAVPQDEEMERMLPMIEAVAGRFDIPISVDTYKAEVARAALGVGAHMINDVWGAKKDPNIAHVAAETEAPIILMHNRDNKEYTDLLPDMLADLQQSIDVALQSGVRKQQMMLDPGIGFAKTYEHNMEVMRRLDELTALGYPVLLGTSRKRFIGRALNLPVEERLEGTLATLCQGVSKGCHMVRVHDVREAVRVVEMMDAMLGKGRSPACDG